MCCIALYCCPSCNVMVCCIDLFCVMLYCFDFCWIALFSVSHRTLSYFIALCVLYLLSWVMLLLFLCFLCLYFLCCCICCYYFCFFYIFLCGFLDLRRSFKKLRVIILYFVPRFFPVNNKAVVILSFLYFWIFFEFF